MSRYRKNGPAFQTGSTQKLTLVVILAISFIAIVIVIARMALHNVQQKIQADAVDALQTVLQTTQDFINIASIELASICDRLIQLAEDFELDGILKLVAELENSK